MMTKKELIEAIEKSSDNIPIQVRSCSGMIWEIVKIEERKDKPILEIVIR